jgi:ankyrin repeat protein
VSQNPITLGILLREARYCSDALDHGANPNVEDSHNEVPLHLLSRGKYSSQDDGVSVARLLLEHGADVNAQNIDLRTPLHHASYNGNVVIAQVLLEHGGTPHAGDSNGETPLHLALRGNNDSEEHGIGMTRLLLEYGADVDAEDDDGETPFGLSSRLRKSKIANILFEHSVNFDTD